MKNYQSEHQNPNATSDGTDKMYVKTKLLLVITEIKDNEQLNLKMFHDSHTTLPYPAAVKCPNTKQIWIAKI